MILTPVFLLWGHLHFAVIAFGVLSPRRKSFPLSQVILQERKFFQSNLHFEVAPSGGVSSVLHVWQPESLVAQKWPFAFLNRHFVRLRAIDRYHKRGLLKKHTFQQKKKLKFRAKPSLPKKLIWVFFSNYLFKPNPGLQICIHVASRQAIWYAPVGTSSLGQRLQWAAFLMPNGWAQLPDRARHEATASL